MKAGLTILCIGLALPWSFGSSPTLRIMPLGDSITHGYGTGIPEPLDGYRKVLKTLLETNGYTTDFVGSQTKGSFPDNQHEGHNGLSANAMLASVAGWLGAAQPHIVLLHVGTNDCIENHEDADEISDILDQIFIASSNATVVLALIINSKPTTPQVADISAFNNAVEAMALTRIANGDDIVLVDMENDAGLNYSSADMADDWHPSIQGYAKMATNWYPAVVTALHQQQAGIPLPQISSISATGSAIQLSFDQLSTGCLTQVERSGSLTEPVWSNQWSFTPNTTETNWTDPLSTTSAFYRIVAPQRLHTLQLPKE